MKDKYKYILYILLFISVSVVSLFVIRFYNQYMVPNIQAEQIQQAQLDSLVELNRQKDSELVNLEMRKNQEITEQVEKAKQEKDLEYQAFIEELNQKIASMESELSDYQTELDNLSISNDNEINDIKLKHQEEISLLTSKLDVYKDEIAKLTKQYSDESSQQKLYYESKLLELEKENSDMKKEMAYLTAKHEQDLKDINLKYEEYIDQLQGEITMQTQNNETLMLSVSELEKEITSLKADHKKAYDMLMAEILFYEENLDKVYLSEDIRFMEQKANYIKVIDTLKQTIAAYEENNDIALITKAYEEKMTQLQTTLDQYVKDTDASVNQLELEVLKYKQQLNDLLQGSQQESLNIKNSYEVKIDQLNETISAFETENVNLKTDIEKKNNELSLLSIRYDEDIAALKARHADIMQQAETQYQTSLASLESSKKAEIDNLLLELKTYKENYLELEKSKNAEIAGMNAQLQNAINEENRLIRDYESKITALENAKSESIALIDNEYQKKMILLEAELKSYQSQLELSNSLLSDEVEEVSLEYQGRISELQTQLLFYLSEIDRLEDIHLYNTQVDIYKYRNEISHLNEQMLFYEEKISQLELSSSTVVSVSADDERKVVYLTFDDGPSEMTVPILDILDRYGIKATFFVVYRQGFQNEYKEIYERGHTIGNHTYSHDYNLIYASVDNFYDDVKKLDDYIYSLTKSTTLILRFPGGTNSSWTTNDIKMQIMEESYKRGYIYYDWNASAGDGAPVVYSEEDIVKNATKTFNSDNDVYLLMHDSKKTYTTVDALDNLIEFYLSNGYTFLPITYETPQCKMYNPQ